MKTAILTIEHKKHLFHSLSQEFLSGTDASGLTFLKNDILGQVISCEFCAEMAGIADVIIPMWNESLDAYIHAVSINEVNSEARWSAEAAFLGLSHLMDSSELAVQTTGVQQLAAKEKCNR